MGGIPATANQYAYLTLNGGVEWLHLFGEKLSLTVAGHRANYDPELRFPQESGSRIDFLSGIDYTIGKASLAYAGEQHRLTGGLQYDHYRLAPGRIDPGGVEGVLPITLEDEIGNEIAAYVEDEWEVSDRLTVSGGLRYVHYRQLGPASQRIYAEGEVVREGSLVSETQVGKGETLQTYGGLEPRLGLNYRLNDYTSLKISYARGRQYLQNIYNATTPVPTSRWKVSDRNVGPQTSDLFSAGITHRSRDEKYLFSLEAYYRTVDDLLEYRPGADFFLNPAVETDLTRGQGRSYGVELTARCSSGRLTGELNYAYARSENQVVGPSFETTINRGDWYPGYFDQPHTFNANLILNEGKTHELGFNLVVQSNRPYTVPNGFVTIRDTPVPLFLERNNDRLPLYHRLDFSWTIHNFRREQRRWTGDWVFTVFNVYGRDNAYNIFFQPRDANTPPLGIFSGSPFAAYRLSVFGAPIISLAYKFTFLP